MIVFKSYINNKHILSDKEIFFYGFEHTKTDKIDKYILIGCGLEGFYENDKLFNFWSNIFLNKEIKNKDFKITG